MNDIKKRLATIILAGFMITSTCGCNKTDPISTVNEQSSNQEDSTITLDQLKYYYIVEVSDFENQHRFYLTYKVPKYNSHSPDYDEYIISGSDDVVLATNNFNSEVYKCDFGKVINVIEFIQYIQKYSTIKSTYKTKEIDDIFNKIVEDYKNLNEKEKTKSLTLK